MDGKFITPERAFEIYRLLKTTGRLSCSDRERDQILEVWASLPRKATLCHALMVIAMPESRQLIEGLPPAAYPMAMEDVSALLARQAF